MQHDHGVSVGLPAVLRRPRGDAEAERDVGHGHDDHPVPRLGVLGDAREGGLGHGVAEEEGALGVGLEPDAAARVGREEVERVDGEVERAVVGELADGGAHGGEARAGDGVVVMSMADVPLGFGIAARSAQDCRKADTNAVVVLHQADAGEYLRKEEELM